MRTRAGEVALRNNAIGSVAVTQLSAREKKEVWHRIMVQVLLSSRRSWMISEGQHQGSWTAVHQTTERLPVCQMRMWRSVGSPDLFFLVVPHKRGQRPSLDRLLFAISSSFHLVPIHPCLVSSSLPASLPSLPANLGSGGLPACKRFSIAIDSFPRVHCP